MADGGIADILAWKDASGGLHVVPIDLVVSHDDDRSAEVTSHPVEKGSNINDHIIQHADKLTIEIAQTDSPFPTAAQPGVAFTAPKGFIKKSIALEVRENLFKPGGLLAVTSAVGGAITSLTNALGITSPADAAKVNVWTTDTPIDRIGELHDTLIGVKSKGQFCVFTYRGKVYPDYLITRVKWSTAKGEAGLGRFSVELQSVRIVETAVANIADPASLRLKPKKSQSKPLKPVEDPKPGAGGGGLESLLSKGTGLGV